MAVPFYNNIDLNGLEIWNVSIQKLATAPDTPFKGQIYFNTTDNKAYVYNGTAFIDITSTLQGTVTSVTGTGAIESTGGATPVISIKAASGTTAGSMSSADFSKLAGIAAGAQVNVATNIAQGTRTSTSVPITSSTGTGATLDVATTSLAGVMSSADKTKLDGIATGANNYSHPTGDGNLHVPATGTSNSGKVLTAGATAGSLSWTTPNAGTVTSVSGQGAISVATGTTTPVVSIAAASGTVPGTMSAADYTKLLGIEAGAQVNVGTDLSLGTKTATTIPLNSSTGADVTLPAATTDYAGLMTADQFDKLAGIATGATANTGTVTSVGGTGTVSGLTLSGTVTTSGNLTLGGTLAVTASNFASQSANTVLAAPNGSAGKPTFRTLVAADIPSLDAAKITSGTIDAARLPSYVDDVIEAANFAALPGTGESGKIYVCLDTNKTYRWGGSAYTQITSGAVDSVAGRTGVITLSTSDISGLGTIATQASNSVSITGGTISGITDLAIADGGTGASNAAAARTNLGLAIGTNVQAYDAQLTDIAALAVTDGNFIVGNGTTFVAESGATARTSLGLGSIATQAANSVSITGGSITGITDLAVADGGTGASTAAGAKTNLGFLTRYATNIGDGTSTSISVTHNLGTRDVTVELYRNSAPYDKVYTDIQHTSTSAVTLVFAVAPASAAFRCVVTG